MLVVELRASALIGFDGSTDVVIGVATATGIDDVVAGCGESVVGDSGAGGDATIDNIAGDWPRFLWLPPLTLLPLP